METIVVELLNGTKTRINVKSGQTNGDDAAAKEMGKGLYEAIKKETEKSMDKKKSLNPYYEDTKGLWKGLLKGIGTVKSIYDLNKEINALHTSAKGNHAYASDAVAGMANTLGLFEVPGVSAFSRTIGETYSGMLFGTLGPERAKESILDVGSTYAQEPNQTNYANFVDVVKKEEQTFQNFDKVIRESEAEEKRLIERQGKLRLAKYTAEQLEADYAEAIKNNASEADFAKLEERADNLGNYTGYNNWQFEDFARGDFSRKLQKEIEQIEGTIPNQRKQTEELREWNSTYYNGKLTAIKGGYTGDFDKDYKQWLKMKEGIEKTDMTEKEKEMAIASLDLTEKLKGTVGEVAKLNWEVQEIPGEIRCDVGVFYSEFNKPAIIANTEGKTSPTKGSGRTSTGSYKKEGTAVSASDVIAAGLGPRNPANYVNNGYGGLREKKITDSVRLPGFANGRIVNGPMVSLIGEAGPEAVIPLGAERRRRGLGLWMQAGEMMGITAEGGKTGYEVSPLGGSVPLSISLGGMNFTINGTDTANGESIVAAIRAQLPSVTNEIAAMLSQLLSDSYSNMTLQAAG